MVVVRRSVLIALLLCAMLLLYGTQITSAIWGNYAWLQLAHAKSSGENENNASIYFLKQLPVEAVKRSVHESLFLQWGNFYRNRAKWDDALLYYSYVEPNDSAFDSVSVFAGEVCQKSFAFSRELEASSQRRCQEIIKENRFNLLMNSQFDFSGLSSWEKRRFDGFSGVYIEDPDIGRPAPSALIDGRNHEETGGLSQIITLRAGEIVQYGAWLKLDDKALTQARLLHILWQQHDGSPGGREFAQPISQNGEWQWYEYEFRVPDAKGAEFRFSPVLLTGAGKVWVDDVTLQVVDR